MYLIWSGYPEQSIECSDRLNQKRTSTTNVMTTNIKSIHLRSVLLKIQTKHVDSSFSSSSPWFCFQFDVDDMLANGSTWKMIFVFSHSLVVIYIIWNIHRNRLMEFEIGKWLMRTPKIDARQSTEACCFEWIWLLRIYISMEDSDFCRG